MITAAAFSRPWLHPAHLPAVANLPTQIAATFARGMAFVTWRSPAAPSR
ncbi:hypothetical protein APY04_2596 [Hyphomicrobium sulfonivorans]|uniref:Uncharacterized protein n=1 Tax=Hyphomicrobium sulfonivorans TaxID=121290 RepID=A0A109BCC4_HYPSL|nr:hypothetical protein APY04_2596 [Hyphomicrobium sulfonivorans]